MAGGDITEWEPVFDDLVLELEEATSPSDRSGTWYQGLAQFSRHSYARLLVSPVEAGLGVYLEIALGPTDDPERLADALVDRLSDVSGTEWELETRDTPWVLETTFETEADETTEALRTLLLDLLEIAEHFDAVDSTGEWLDVLAGRDGSSGRDDDAETREEDRQRPDDESKDDRPDEPGDDAEQTPFESIGDGSSRPDDRPDPDDATVETTKVVRRDDRLVVAIGLSEVLDSRHLEALHEGLDHHLHTKFEVDTRSADPSDVEMPSSARTVLSRQIDPADYIGDLDQLHEDVEQFLERLEKFSSYGVDLFEYLGVGETVFDSGPRRPEDDEDDEEESELDFTPRAAPSRPERRLSEPRSRSRPAEPADEQGVVLELDAPAGETTGGALEAKNYTDPRLQRPDAETALVDVVLRHPGYSDERIGQVLSILLSVEYHDALDLADDAPCVIAWGVSQSRARRFKDVIESAGGKVVLVEPGTFGEG